MPEQLSFIDIFAEAAFEQRTSHFPTEMEAGITFYRGLLERYNEAIVASNLTAAEAFVEEAHDLALKLNGGDVAILADESSSAHVLERVTAAEPGTVPLWGQLGEFIVQPRPGLRVHVAMDGIFGIPTEIYPSFTAHAVDLHKPFISPTGFQSFIGWRFPLQAGMKPNDYAMAVLDDAIKRWHKKGLPTIETKYRQRLAESMPEWVTSSDTHPPAPVFPVPT